MIDLYLDPDFTVEGSDFVFKAHDDDKKDYIVRVAFDDLAAWLEVPSEDITKISISNTEKTTISGTCQQIVDRYQTGTTSYDVEIKPKKVEYIKFTKIVKRTQVSATIRKSNFLNPSEVAYFMRKEGFTKQITVLA
jgi:hypothetical protein